MLLQKQRNQLQLPLIQKARASLPASFVSAEAALTARRKQPSDGRVENVYKHSVGRTERF